MTVVHIVSFTWMCKIFENAGLSAVLFPKESLSYLCTEKVSLMSKGGNLAKAGYIICEKNVIYSLLCGCKRYCHEETSV